MQTDSVSDPAPRTSRGKFFLFLPAGLDRGKFLKWLRRTHAWFGLGGAVLGIFFGFTGITLNHVIEGDVQQSQFDILVPKPRPANLEQFVDWFEKELQLTHFRDETYKPSKIPDVEVDGKRIPQPEQWAARFVAPSNEMTVHYYPGNAFAEVKQIKRGVIDTFNILHRQIGTNLPFVLLTDAVAGAMVFLAITGLLLWTRLSGTRMLALALLFGSTALALIFFLQSNTP